MTLSSPKPYYAQPDHAVGSGSSPYDELAEYYDLIHTHVKEDIPFYLSLAQETGGPILELGCGSGRTLLPLVKAGYEVVGLDNSRPMLQRAELRLQASGLGNSVRLIEAEMGMSWRTWGERIWIRIAPVEGERSGVMIESRPLFKYSLVDYGKAHENIHQIVAAIEERTGRAENRDDGRSARERREK